MHFMGFLVLESQGSRPVPRGQLGWMEVDCWFTQKYLVVGGGEVSAKIVEVPGIHPLRLVRQWVPGFENGPCMPFNP